MLLSRGVLRPAPIATESHVQSGGPTSQQYQCDMGMHMTATDNHQPYPVNCKQLRRDIYAILHTLNRLELTPTDKRTNSTFRKQSFLLSDLLLLQTERQDWNREADYKRTHPTTHTDTTTDTTTLEACPPTGIGTSLPSQTLTEQPNNDVEDSRAYNRQYRGSPTQRREVPSQL